MNNPFQALIGAAIHNAQRHAGPDAVVTGLVAALRRLRGAVGDQGGPVMAANFDALVRSRLVLEQGRERAITLADPVPAGLPAPGPRDAVATAILEDAAEALLMLNAGTPDNAALVMGGGALLEALIQRLGKAPDWASLIHALQSPTGPAAVPSRVLH